jgi:glycine betaine/proline transport system substrate-binding protein
MKRNVAGTLLVVFFLSVGSAWSAEKVMIGEPSWPGAKIIANVIKEVITTKLGVQAGLVPGANAAIYAGMDKGRGDIDVHPDVWLPNQKSFTDKYVEANKTVALSEGYYEGATGFCVPTYMAEEHGIKSVFDLATPQAQGLFDLDNDGKGEIWLGASGWGSTKINQVKVRDYGIGDFLTPTTEDEAIFYSKIAAAVKKKAGVVFYCYKPHYVHKLYDVTMLQEPAHDPAKYKIVQPDQDSEWFTKSKITTGDPKKTVRVAYSRSLEKRAPEVARFLKNISLTDAAVSAMTHDVVVEKQEPATVASDWVQANSQIVDGWLGL